MNTQRVFDIDAARSQLEPLLPDFISAQRWFRAKTRTIQEARIEDVLPVPDSSCYILVIRLDYADGNSDNYILVITFGDGVAGSRPAADGKIIATDRTGDGSEGNVYDGLFSKEFRASLLNAVACDATFASEQGALTATRTVAFRSDCGTPDLKLESVLSRAEQSNTSIIYGDRFILKLFRKIEPGINPDIEMGTFLTERGFKHTPAVLGKLEYRRTNENIVYAAGILQEFVRNEGDAWKYTLEALDRFFDRVLAREGSAPVLKSYHPMQLMPEDSGPEMRQLLGEYADSARLLGRRTAEMHAAFADARGNLDFAPEPFTPADGQKLYEEMLSQADIAFELLRRKQPALTETTAEDARRLLRMEHRVIELFSPLRQQSISTARVRTHGDYHLGQVLYTGTDFMIIDFEGEPARPLSERRTKTLALRDIAGMIRSFQYAAYAALFGRASGIDAATISTLESWATFWTAWIGATYLNGYFRAAEGLSFVSADVHERRLLLDSFLLQKALYEVAYELNNRPDWVRIPLCGILNLLS